MSDNITIYVYRPCSCCEAICDFQWMGMRRRRSGAGVDIVEIIFRIWFGRCCRRRQYFSFINSFHSSIAHTLKDVQVADWLARSSSINSFPIAICKLAYTFLYNRVLRRRRRRRCRCRLLFCEWIRQMITKCDIWATESKSIRQQQQRHTRTFETKHFQ